MLPPVKIAGCALRIAWALSDKGNSIPSVDAFAKAIKERKLQEEFKQILPEIEQEEDTLASGQLADAFRSLFKKMGYSRDGRPGDQGVDRLESDIGIPKVMRTRLSPSLLHVLLLRETIAQRPGSEAITDSREELIRFVLFWHLCINNEDKASVRCFEIIRKAGRESISLRALYRKLTDPESDPVAFRICRPEEMDEVLMQSQATLNWPYLGERFNSDAEPFKLARRWWLSNDKFLMWLQRHYLDAKFADFDPSSGRDDETPYDVDHIVPQADWGGYWKDVAWRYEVLDKSQLNKIQHSRWDVGDCIGNKWLVDFSSNREWGDGGWDGKDGKLQRLLSIHAIDKIEEQRWTEAWGSKADTKERKWTERRLVTFQEAIERRAAWLYRRFYEEAGFSDWEDASVAAFPE